MTEPAFAPIDSAPVPAPGPAPMQARNCPLCDRDDAEPIYQLDDFQFFSDNPLHRKRAAVRHVRCRACLTLYMNPTYTSAGFALLFEEAAQSYGASVIRQDEQLAWLAARKLLEPGQVFLDVGCYTGNFIAGLPAEIAAVGVDIDAGAIATAQARHGAPHRHFIQADFEQLKTDRRIDVITMFHVLEHLPRPLQVLRMLRALAHPGTALVLEVPVLELAKTNDINGFLTVSHMTHFSVATVSQMAGAAGWRIIDATLQPDYNGYRCVAVPDAATGGGFDPVDRFLLYDYLAAFYAALAAAQKAVSAIPAGTRRIAWGAGFHTELVYQLTDYFRQPEGRFLLVDSDPAKQGKCWRGVPIHHPDVLETVDWRDCQLLVSSYGHQEIIAADALARGVPGVNIHRLYSTIRRY